MTIELSKEAKQTALESLQKYFELNMDEPLGNLAAGSLLQFILEEIVAGAHTVFLLCLFLFHRFFYGSPLLILLAADVLCRPCRNITAA